MKQLHLFILPKGVRITLLPNTTNVNDCIIHCKVCGRRLKNKKSILIEIGPTCLLKLLHENKLNKNKLFEKSP